MTHIAGFERDQLLLLPEAVDDYVEADNSVRFIDVFVDGPDLAAAGFGRVEAKATGRPALCAGRPAGSSYIYGYSQSGPIEPTAGARGRCNVEVDLVAWLTLKF